MPEPEFIGSDDYVAPRNELEHKLCQIWSEVLGLTVDNIGIKDDFFRLGGNSILAIRLVNRISIELTTIITISTILKHNTIDKLAHYLELNSTIIESRVEYEV